MKARDERRVSTLRLVNAAFQTADQLRRVQRVAYRTRQLADAYPDRGFGSVERKRRGRIKMDGLKKRNAEMHPGREPRRRADPERSAEHGLGARRDPAQRRAQEENEEQEEGGRKPRTRFSRHETDLPPVRKL